MRVTGSGNSQRRLEMMTPIYNERSCSEAACHAHPAGVKVLGVLDLALNLESVDHEVDGMKLRVLVVTAVEIALISLFIIFFTRRFLSRPIEKLIEGTKAVSQMDLDEPLDIVGSSEELDELARSFDVMRERLRTALGEINQFTQKLETKVEERTEQLKAAQKKLVQSDRLASLGQLSASVAHEINNPVSGVLNLAMLMQRMLKDDGVPPERLVEFRKYLSQVVNETSRVGRIVSDLLAFSRRGKPQRAPADLNRIVRMTLSLVQHKLKLSNVEVEADLRERPAAGALRRLADPAGGAEPGAQCRRSHPEQSCGQAPGPRFDRNLYRRRHGVADGGGQRRRHSAGEPGPDFRSVLHHQVGRQRRGAGAGGLLRHHPGPRRRYRSEEQGGSRRHVRGVAAAGAAGSRAADRANRRPWPERMKYVYVGATPEVDREALAAIRRAR